MLVLEGIRIIELVHLPPGELCTMILGDLGADIVKVEAPSKVSGRGAGLMGGKDAEAFKSANAYNAINRNKKSVVINLKSEKGLAVFYRLAQHADVIVEGFRPGAVKRMGVDYETVKRINPRTVYCSLSGYGQDGPYSQFPGHDINYISIAGALGLIGLPGQLPTIPLNFLADFAGASLHGAIGILAALFAREKTGKGQYVDISYTDGVITLMTFFLQNYLGLGLKFPRGEGGITGAYPYYNMYWTSDHKIISIGCAEPWFWENLCEVIGRPDLKSYTFNPFSHTQKPEDPIWDHVKKELADIFLKKTRDEWFELLIKNDIPAGKVNSIDEMVADPQLLHRNMILEMEHPKLGKVKQPGIAIKLSETPGKVRSFAPYSGEHTEEVLSSIGYSSEDLSQLLKAGAIG